MKIYLPTIYQILPLTLQCTCSITYPSSQKERRERKKRRERERKEEREKKIIEKKMEERLIAIERETNKRNKKKKEKKETK